MYFANKLTVALAGLVVGATTALAASELPGLEGYIGKTTQEISAALTEKGFEVRKVEREDGYLEAYALKEGGRYEIYVDPKTGNFVKASRD